MQTTNVRNRKVKRQTPAEKRVAIAKDALAWLDAGALNTNGPGYISGNSELTILRAQSDKKLAATQLRDVSIGPCSVCAMGALFIAKAVRFNHATLYDTMGSRPAQNLRGYFAVEQLRAIEFAYEGIQTSPYSDLRDIGLSARAYKFYSKAPAGRTARLRAILKNIIANDGEFNP